MTNQEREFSYCKHCGVRLTPAEPICKFCTIEPIAHKSLQQGADDLSFLCVAASLSFPIWGTVLTVLLGCTIGEPIVYVAMVLAVFSAWPIWSGMSGALTKLVLSMVYYFVGFFVVFFLGWLSLCWFCPTCH